MRHPSIRPSIVMVEPKVKIDADVVVSTTKKEGRRNLGKTNI
jgi:hypothetical protein